jgi:hypothetical protein
MRSVAFLHIPKCGGISIEAILKSAFHADEVSPLYFTREFESQTSEMLGAYRLIIGHFDFDTLKLLPEQFLKAIVFREPLALLVSLYNHAASRPAHRLHTQIKSGDLPFDKFCTSAPGSRNIISKSLLGRKVYAQLTKSDMPRKIEIGVDMALENLARFDCVGMLDQLDAFRTDLIRQLDCALPKLPRLNSSPRAVSIERLTEMETESFLNHNQMDIAVYRAVREFYEKKKATGIL